MAVGREPGHINPEPRALATTHATPCKTLLRTRKSKWIRQAINAVVSLSKVIPLSLLRLSLSLNPLSLTKNSPVGEGGKVTIYVFVHSRNDWMTFSRSYHPKQQCDETRTGIKVSLPRRSFQFWGDPYEFVPEGTWPSPKNCPPGHHSFFHNITWTWCYRLDIQEWVEPKAIPALARKRDRPLKHLF